MESGSKIVSANVSTETYCELAASSLNSLPGGSFMEVNADMNSTCTEILVSLLLVILLRISGAQQLLQLELVQ